jgi:hypothetical protein
MIALVESVECRHFLTARLTPRRPEVHDHNFATLTRQIKFLTVQFLDREWRRGIADAHRESVEARRDNGGHR